MAVEADDDHAAGMVNLTPEGRSKLLRVSGTVRGLADFYDVAPNTILRLKKGRPLRIKLLQEMLRKRKDLKIRDLIMKDERREVPRDLTFFLKLKYSYFVDHDENAGDPVWIEETITWLETSKRRAKQAMEEGEQPGRPVVLRGTIFNDRGGEFRFWSHRTQLGRFAIAAYGDRNAFHAVFPYQLKGRDVLVGFWVGEDLCGEPTVYGMALSAERLSEAELVQGIYPVSELGTVLRGNELKRLKNPDAASATPAAVSKAEQILVAVDKLGVSETTFKKQVRRSKVRAGVTTKGIATKPGAKGKAARR